MPPSFGLDAGDWDFHFRIGKNDQGPGVAGQVHQTDEYCHVSAILEAREAYVAIAKKWLS
ncbi:MAG: hypothetical protein M1398_02625 [Deltaproteobacteria bacterium]|nr:hypothetical protein [Deltaproteobacteria bacterium]